MDCPVCGAMHSECTDCQNKRLKAENEELKGVVRLLLGWYEYGILTIRVSPTDRQTLEGRSRITLFRNTMEKASQLLKET